MSDMIAGIFIPPEELDKSCATCKYLYESMNGPHCAHCGSEEPEVYFKNWEQKDAKTEGSS